MDTDVVTRQVEALPAQMTAADELFAALDGQIVSDGADFWEVRVWGIHRDEARGRFWLQIGFLGEESVSGTVAVAPGHAFDALYDFVEWRLSARETDTFRALTAACLS